MRILKPRGGQKRDWMLPRRKKTSGRGSEMERRTRRWRMRNSRLGNHSRRVWWSWKRKEESGRLQEETSAE
jgi:hypothetical protein